MKKLIVALVLVNVFGLMAQNSKKPNVIIIYNDDLGYQDLGCYGSPNIKTPRIDQMAKEGVRFTDCYSASPVCSASRAALLTGCYPQRVGVPGVISAGANQGLSPKNTTLAEILKSVGYATAAVGKWHLGDQPQHLPTNQGFDSFFGIPYSNDMYPSKNIPYAANCQFNEGYDLNKINEAFANMKPGDKQPESAKHKVPLMRNLETIEFPVDQTTITKRYADEGISFIKQSVKDKKPFFLYLANSMPHIPLYVSPQFKGKSKRGLYGDVVEEIDYNTGRILDVLKELKIDKNTIVIFSSDNGPWLAKGADGGSALPLFEGKFTSFEGGLRVPFIIKWPNEIKADGVCKKLISTIDILPTLASITGAKLPEMEIDGTSVLDLWKGDPSAKNPHEFYFMIYTGQSVRSGDWKYHKKQIFSVNKDTQTDKSPALYNLKDDIGETKNLLNEYPEIAQKLAKALDEHLSRINVKK
ncbi:sulfatase family protein [Flavobacterium nackdongense]|uniref:Arylsulfatase n=1 Tax=Flavobacterium nackdongense TaxID=2547394 RepID=A0A4P6Y823_9FLAO|nr:sulfatase [Flavobacterium nackdongense]QBN17888.1 arylsulfatase [Flavobacterium nackdongense]